MFSLKTLINLANSSDLFNVNMYATNMITNGKITIDGWLLVALLTILYIQWVERLNFDYFVSACCFLDTVFFIVTMDICVTFLTNVDEIGEMVFVEC